MGFPTLFLPFIDFGFKGIFPWDFLPELQPHCLCGNLCSLVGLSDYCRPNIFDLARFSPITFKVCRVPGPLSSLVFSCDESVPIMYEII